MATSAKRRAPSAPADTVSTPDAEALAPAPAAKPPRARKTAAKTATPPVAAEPVVPAAEPAAEAPTAKPARKRTRASSPAPAAEAAEVAAPEAAAPAPRARGKKAPSKKAEPALAPIEAAAESEPTPEPTPEAEPAPLAAVAELAVAPAEVEAPVAEPAPAIEAEAQPLVEPVTEAPAEPPAPPPAPRPAHSQITLQDDGLRRHLRWQSGSRCPESLLDAVAPLQQLGGMLALGSTDALGALVAEAARTGHRLLVDDAVWAHLAALGDLHGRIDHLAALYPQGLDEVALPEAPQPQLPRPSQLEGAFFLACVGACLVADDTELEPAREVALASQLVRRHFGASAITVLAPSSALAEWQTLLSPAVDGAEVPADALRLLAWDEGADPAALAATLAAHPAEVLIVDQRTGLREPLPALALEPTWCWVLTAPDLLQADRPAAEAWLRRIDRQRAGALADWLDGADDGVLAPLLLQRRFADVAAQWPAWARQTLACPLPQAQRAAHDQAEAAAVQLLVRWQRSGFLSDSDQLALRRQLQAQQLACREAGAAALPALLQQALADGVRRVVVFSEDAEALPALAAQLREAGLPAFDLPVGPTPRDADPLLRQFRDAPEAQVLLVADGAPGDEPRITVQPQRPLVIHLDRPWEDAVRERRLQRVRAARTQRALPVWQLLPADTLASRREAQPVPAQEGAAPTASAGLRRGAALQAWMAELLACLAMSVPAASA